MAEQASDPADHTQPRGGANENEHPSDADQKARDKEFARMRRIGAWHASAVLAALTLWGSADFWATGSGLLLAQAVALGNAIVAGVVISSILHEWGHFSGARLAGAISPVFAKPKRFYFMFQFDMEANSADQFIWMSLGGIIANWLFAIAVLILVPLQTLAGAMLAAVAIAQAVNVSVFEVPIVLRTRETQNPQSELDHQLNNAGLRRTPGLIVGALAFLALT